MSDSAFLREGCVLFTLRVIIHVDVRRARFPRPRLKVFTPCAFFFRGDGSVTLEGILNYED